MNKSNKVTRDYGCTNYLSHQKSKQWILNNNQRVGKAIQQMFQLTIPDRTEVSLL